jgi:hypothetical protein
MVDPLLAYRLARASRSPPILLKTGHKSVAVVSRYVRAVEIFKDVGVL